MSGGGGYGSGVGGGGPSGVACSELTFEATLQSPKADVVEQLIEKDKLPLVLKGTDGPVVAKHPTHGEAGAIIARLPDLLRCMNGGTKYIAEVISIDGGVVRVRVTPVP